MLKNVLGVPSLSLLSVNKLSKDNDCEVVFHSAFCVIRDTQSHKVRGIGRLHNGLYYKMDAPLDSIDLNTLCLVTVIRRSTVVMLLV